MEISHFIFRESLKAISLIFLGLLAVKVVSTLRIPAAAGRRWPAMVKAALYLLALVLATLGARVLGDDTAAEVYYLAALKNISQHHVLLAYSNALQAVKLRPAELRYWQALEEAKIAGHQFYSVLEDAPAIRRLSGGALGESDSIRFATCHYFLGQYEQALAVSGQVIQKNRFYPVAYVVQGLAYTALRQYAAAERTYLALLEIFPNSVDGVVGLSHAYYLNGNTPRALAVLDATQKYDFTPQARTRFEELKALYAQ